jgi:hypothetical protein
VPTPQTVIQRNTDQINLNMKIFTLIALLLVVYCGRSQTGNISGNAFWKYNDYVGNKPDAASDVLLYRIDSPSIKRPDKIQTKDSENSGCSENSVNENQINRQWQAPV